MHSVNLHYTIATRYRLKRYDICKLRKKQVGEKAFAKVLHHFDQKHCRPKLLESVIVKLQWNHKKTNTIIVHDESKVGQIYIVRGHSIRYVRV